MPEPPSIAADTNVLLDYAKEDETVIDCSYEALKLVLDAADVPAPLIASPWKIVHQFFR
jgi:hypothetical protein